MTFNTALEGAMNLELEKYNPMCIHSFVKTTAVKSEKVTYYCIHCNKPQVEEVRPVSKVFKIKK